MGFRRTGAVPGDPVSLSGGSGLVTLLSKSAARRSRPVQHSRIEPLTFPAPGHATRVHRRSKRRGEQTADQPVLTAPTDPARTSPIRADA